MPKTRDAKEILVVMAVLLLATMVPPGGVSRANAQLFSSDKNTSFFHSQKQRTGLLNTGKSPLNTGVSPYAKKKYHKKHHYLKRLLSWF